MLCFEKRNKKTHTKNINPKITIFKKLIDRGEIIKRILRMGLLQV